MPLKALRRLWVPSKTAQAFFSQGGVEVSADGWVYTRKLLTFTGAAGAGAAGTMVAFTVTGTIYVEFVIGENVTDLTTTGAATVSLGVAADVDAFWSSITATNFDAGEFWTAGTGLVAGAATVADTASSDATAAARSKVVNTNIILTIASADINGGTMNVYMRYRPLTANGKAV